MRIALANIRFPSSPEVAVQLAQIAVIQAALAGVKVVSFPECYIPGYRPGKPVQVPTQEFLESALKVISETAAEAKIAVVLGMERVVEGKNRATAAVIGPDGRLNGYQDKVQLDPSEDSFFEPGAERRVFQVGDLTFGVVICHEGWRYPETVRWAARYGAQVVFHQQFHEAEPNGYVPTTYGEQGNSFHEKSLLCRAAENTVFVATTNYACPNSPTTSAFINPDGTLISYQPYGVEGLLIADLDLSLATGLLASRLRT